MSIKIIKPYLKKSKEEHSRSLVGNLYAIGKSKAPGARTFLTPKSDGQGRFLTGLDENSRKLEVLPPDIKQEMKEKIREKRIRLEAALGVDLSATSNYWRSLDPYVLKDEDNVFDLSDPEKEVTFTWLCEITSLIAGSLEEVKSGKLKEKTGFDPEFYIFSPTENVEKEFNRKKRINESVKKLDVLGESELRRIQYLLNLNIPNSSPFSEVYSLVDEFLRTPKSYAKADPVDDFERVLSYSSESLNIKYLVKKLIELRLVKQVGDGIVEGNNTIAKSIVDFESLLQDPEIYYTWEKKLEQKLNIVNAI